MKIDEFKSCFTQLLDSEVDDCDKRHKIKIINKILKDCRREDSSEQIVENIGMYKLDAFQAAESFHRFAVDCVPDDWMDWDDGSWFNPSVVNMALACELYMKSMLNIQVKDHDFSTLFHKLEEKQQREILESPSFKGDDKFQDKLTFSGNSFEEWRYSFEGKGCSVDLIFLENFSITLHDVAEKEIQPYLIKYEDRSSRKE